VKKQIKYLILAALFVSFSLPETANSQGWGGRWKPGFWDKWSVNVNGGLTSFFGDLSLYDTDIADKLTKESGPAFGMLLSKNLAGKFDITGQLLYGTLKGQNSTTVFNANVIEYNVQGRVFFIDLFSPDNYSNFDVYGYVGAGQFRFKSEQYKIENPSEKSIEDTGTPEFVYFFGFGLEYKFMEKFGMTVDMGMRQAQNDKLDDLVKNKNYDYYSYLSIGFTYYIESFKKSSRGGRSSFGRSGRGRAPMRRRR
jgi:hypothetical protein